MTDSAARNGHWIVVGVDGSLSSRSALRWAIHQAQLTGARVDAVTAIDFAEDVRRILTQAMAGEMAVTGSGVQVRPQVILGHPAQVLLNAAGGADLLVVGSRGHGGFTEALLGSVAQHCVHHAPCPVVIIRGKGQGRDDEDVAH